MLQGRGRRSFVVFAVPAVFAAAIALVPHQKAYSSSTAGLNYSGVLAPGGPTVESLYWTDNTHVLFIGAKPEAQRVLPDGRKVLRRFLMHWNVSGRHVSELVEVPGTNVGLCYDRGHVRYWYAGNSGLVVRAGPFSQIKNLPLIARAAAMEGVNKFTCKEPSGDQSFRARGYVPLREEHGYWGGNEEARKRGMSIYLHKVEGGFQEVLVPILAPPPRWSDFAQAYVFERRESASSRDSVGGKMWLLYPDGRTREFSIPLGPWFGGSTGYGITRQGIFMYSHALDGHRNGHAGGYLIADDGNPERIVAGLVYAFGISPDGCSIAMSVRVKDGPREAAELAAAQICRKEK